MKKINVNKIIEDENMFAEIVVTEDETLFKYLSINNWDYLKIPNDIKIIGRGIFVAKDLKTIKKIYKENKV